MMMHAEGHGLVPEAVEPDLHPFEADRWEFPDDEARDEYEGAVEELRTVLRDTGTLLGHARVVGQLTPAAVRAIAAALADPLEHPAVPVTDEPVADHDTALPRRRWWQTRR